MTLSDLTAYAAEKYHIPERGRSDRLTGLSVLCHPRTSQWIAVLLRRRDPRTGVFSEYCEIRCGELMSDGDSRPYITGPKYMRAGKWVGVAFGKWTEDRVVFRLFDMAVTGKQARGAAVIVEPLTVRDSAYKDVPIPREGRAVSISKANTMPKRLKEMRRMAFYTPGCDMSREAVFYRQAVYMADYEDDVPWTGNFSCYYPTYNDLTPQQQRGYFTWRAAVRRGEFGPIPLSAAYIYVYELINGVGGDSPEERFHRLMEFEKGFSDAGFGSGSLRANVRRWLLDMAVVNSLPRELALKAADPEMLENDARLTALMEPENASDDELFKALCFFGGKKLDQSPAAEYPGKGRRLFCQVWRTACRDRDAFHFCFGEPTPVRRVPFDNAVYYPFAGRQKPSSGVVSYGFAHSGREVCVNDPYAEYELDPVRSYYREKGMWYLLLYDRKDLNTAALKGLLRETDLRLRRYFKTGRYLKPGHEGDWAAKCIDAVLREDLLAEKRAARDSIKVDLSGLDSIRRDAALTRDRLLTDEEREQPEEAHPAAEAPREPAPEPAGPPYMQVLRALAEGRDPSDIIKAGHLLPSVAADAINEALMDAIGDSAVLCEDGRLTLDEEYIEEVKEFLGGTTNG